MQGRQRRLRLPLLPSISPLPQLQQPQASLLLKRLRRAELPPEQERLLQLGRRKRLQFQPLLLAVLAAAVAGEEGEGLR
jgi:hypothetical protein